MPVQDYLDAEHVSDFNKRIVLAAQQSTGIMPIPAGDYGDPARFEFFLPPDQA